jgi:NAD(P)-dependent dehydrogenase (short-subunit alcohol dehydrogenase family)
MDDPLFSVRGQVVLVSGASRGIGRTLAEAFAGRGAQVIITGRNSATLEAAAREISPPGGEVRPLVCDVSEEEAIARLVRTVMEDHGRVDTLLNVAGVNRRMPAEKLEPEDYDFILNTNLRGPFLLSQAVGQGMLKRGKGNQINIVSLNNFRPLKAVLPYGVSKAGLGQMTRALALEWGGRGVRVNAIAPGFILTDLTRSIWSDEGTRAWGTSNTPLGRIGTPGDLVGAAIFLASEASAFITGQILFVDGGFSSGISWPLPESGYT